MLNSLLRQTIVISAMALPAISLMTQAALAGKGNFRVINDSSINIMELYVSDSRIDSWENDILGQDILPSGNQIRVTFGDPSPRTCLYDIRAVFEDGQVLEDYQVNVCANTHYTFFDH